MIKTVELGGTRWTARSPGVIFLTGGKDMSTATLTSKGQITLPKEVREHFKLSEGDRIDFIIEDDGKVRVVPITGSFWDLLGICHRPGVKPLTVREMDELIGETLAEDDRRIREGREVEDWE